MYRPGMSGFGDFGLYLLSSDKLSPKNQYVFTFESGKWIEISSSSDVQDKLRYFLQNYGDVVRVDRALFSGRYTVVVIPKIEATLPQWLTAFIYAWINMGYGDARYISAEGGTTSSQPGGLPQLFTGAGETFGQMLKPLAPYLIGAVALMILLPPLISGAQSAISRRR